MRNKFYFLIIILLVTSCASNVSIHVSLGIPTDSDSTDDYIIEPEWVLNIKEQCEKSNTKFFFKQWGGTNKKKNGRTLEGKTYSEMPLPSDAFQLKVSN